ncbi:hypothetical protein LguiA_033870 [Lonicera macranthoides]
MKISNGQIQLQPHISKDLLKFPDKLSSVTQIQQFLGLVNYMSQFIPNLSKYIGPLAELLKKTPPPWSQVHSECVRKLKKLTRHIPPLQIPSTRTQILQTDAGDIYWAAILFEEIDEKRSVCGYKSGKFKQSESHYHSTFKEILAIRRGIEKFQFHLISHHFTIETYMKSFPVMLQFKNKQIPNPQLLRWYEWFSQWSFTTKHIPGKQNVIADYYSRTQPNQLSHIDLPNNHPSCKPYKYQPLQPQNPQILPCIFPLEQIPFQNPSHQISPPRMAPKSQASSSGSSKPNPSSHPFQFSDFNPLLEPMEAIPYLPREIQDMIFVKWIKCSDKELVTKFLEITLMNYGLVFRGLRLHPTYPFLSLFHIHRPCRIPILALVFLWYLTRAYTICFVFDAPVLLQYLRICIADPEVKSFYEELYNPTAKGSYILLTFLQWFKSPQ